MSTLSYENEISFTCKLNSFSYESLYVKPRLDKLKATRIWAIGFSKVNRGKWLRSSEDIKEANKQVEIYVGRSLTLQIFCFMLIMLNYIIAMLLLVSCMSTHNYLWYFARFCAGSTPKNSQQKHTTKNFVRSLKHSPLWLTMSKRKRHLLLFVIAKTLFTPEIQQAENPD